MSKSISALEKVGKHKYFITFVLFSIYIGFIDTHNLYYHYRIRKQTKEICDQIAKYENQYNTAKNAIEQLKNNPYAVDNVARRNLHMKTNDEDVYVIEETP